MTLVDSSVLGQEVLSIEGGDPFSVSGALLGASPVEETAKDEQTAKDAKSVTKKDNGQSKSEAPTSSKSEDEGEKASDNGKKADVSSEKSSPKDADKSDKDIPKSSASFILAQSFQKDGVIPEDVKFGEDISAKDLKKILLASATKEAEDAIRAEYEQNYGDDILKTANMLRNGIDPEDIKEITAYKRIAGAELTGEDERDLRIKEFAIKAMYQDKGLNEKKINKLFEDAVDEDEAESEFLEAKKHFASKASKMEKEAEDTVKRAEKEAAAKAEESIKDIKAAIKSGNIYGVSTDAERKKLENFVLNNDEVVKQDGKTYKVSGYAKAYAEFNKDINKQLTFAKLLMDGFDLSYIEEMGKSKAHDDLDNMLEATVTKRVGSSASEDKKEHGNAAFNFAELDEVL